MIWFVYAVIHTIFQAIFVELNRIYKIDSWQLNFLHSLFGLAFMLCLFPFISWQWDGQIIFAGLLVSSISTIGCQAQIYMSSQHNGRVASMWRPVATLVSFVMWIALFPETASEYMNDTPTLIAILISFSLSIFSFVLIRRNDIAFRAFLMIAPIGVLYGLVAVVSKFVLPAENGLAEALSLAFYIYFFMTIFSFGGVLAKKRLSKELVSPRFIKAALAIGSSSAIAYIFVLLSFATASNPGFTSVVGMLCPVLIMFYHRLRGIKDDASPWAGFVMIAGAIILAYATI